MPIDADGGAPRAEPRPLSGERLPAALQALEPTYEIIRELGRGGTALVYLARDRATGQEVAVKIIRAKYVEDEEALARFAREARFVAQLDHPNVVPLHAVLDLGDAGIALVMAHVAGRTLKQLIHESGPLSPERAERVMREVALALEAAHAMGIVHRDVKPENIFIDHDGRALLADFGVARSMSSETQLTMSGVAIGTPTYMAPEQIDGAELDGRGDVYSLGLVGWEMLMGRRPWDGESLYAVLYHQKHHELPDVRQSRPDVPDRLGDAIAGAIEKDREVRWQSARELIAALDGHATSRRVAPLPALGSETIRFVRPAAVDAAAPAVVATPAELQPEPARDPWAGQWPENSDVVATVPRLDALAALQAEEMTDAAEPSRRRRMLAGGALAAVAALALVAATVHGRSERTPAGRVVSTADVADAVRPSTPARPVVAGQGVATGEVVAARPAQAVGSDSAVGVPIGGGAAGAGAAPVPPPRTSAPPPSPAPRTRAAAIPPVVAAAAPPAASSTAVSAPAPGPAASRVTIVAGGRHTCLLAGDGRAFCWGGNDRGQLGSGTTTRVATPAMVGANLRFTAVAPGLSHSCAIARGGTAWCWGENDHGQLGDGSTVARLTPTRVADGHLFLHRVAAGTAHSCALDLGGAAWCWGANAHGQLGDGGTTDRTSPVGVAGGNRFASIDAGWDFTCALDRAGRAECWGDNGSGQLGIGRLGDRLAPVAVRGGLSFASISAGSAHACGITTGGETYCWGRNGNGQLGDGTTATRTTPVRVRSDARFVSVAAGAVHTCAITADGDAYCWGGNTYGQLGDGGTSDHLQPVRVAGGHAFASVRAFGAHTCGATVSGEAFCWGYNVDGQLGDGTRTHRTRPVYVERQAGG
jgi:serine/threonine protein kinase/alpha-tubulin suppressor-like RCC1 family protein